MLFEKNLPLGAENFVLTGVRPIETLPQLVWTACSIDAYKVTVALGKIESHILKLYSSKIIQSDMARLVLRKSLQAAYPWCEVERWRISQAFGHRPTVDGPVQLDVSLSHRGCWVVSAFSAERAIGIDIETLPSQLKEDAWDLFLSADEIAWMRRVSQERSALTALALWCAKEAYLKASHQAGKVSMKDIVFSPELKLLKCKGVASKEPWLTQVWQLEGDLLLAVCLGPQQAPSKEQEL